MIIDLLYDHRWKITVVITIALLTLTVGSNLMNNGGNTRALVAEYMFDTGGGEILHDSAPPGYDGSIRGDPDWASDKKRGTVLDFDGDDDYVEITGMPSLESSITVSAWIKSTAGDTYTSSWNAVSRYSQFIMGPESGEMSFIVHTPNNGWTYLNPPTTPDKDTWHHFVGVWNADTGEVQLWMDGELHAETTYTAENPSSNTGPVDIAHRESKGQGTNHLEARIDDVRIYDEAVSNETVRSLYNEGALTWKHNDATTLNETIDLGFSHHNESHVIDSSGKGFHAAQRGNSKQLQALRCEIGRCREFDGVDDNLRVRYQEGSEEINYDGITAMAWVKADSMIAETPGHTSGDNIISRVGGVSGQEDTSNTDDNWRVAIGDKRVGFYTDTVANIDDDIVTDQVISPGEWYHVAATYNATSTDKAIYVNGVREASKTVSGSPPDPLHNNTNPVSIGLAEGWGSGSAFNGSLDEVKVFDQALSLEDVVEQAGGLPGDGAVLNMRFNANGGDFVQDHSPHSNHGQLRSGEASGPTWSDGFKGNALRFDGSDDYVDVPTPSFTLNSTKQATVSAWVKRKSFSGRDEMILNKRGNDRYRFEIKDNYVGIVYYSSSDDDWTATWIPASVDDNEWHHVAWLVENGTLTVYVDGVNKGSEELTYDLPDADGTTYLGNGAGSAEYYGGTLDGLKVHQRALSDSEIERLSDDKTIDDDSSQGLQPVLAQSFDRVETCGQSDTVSCPSGVSGQVAVDESGNADHGELFNGPNVTGSQSCQTSSCLSFDGSDDYVEVNTGVFSDDSNWTASLWFRNENIEKHIHFTGVPDSHSDGWSPMSHFGVRDQSLAWWDSNGWRETGANITEGEWTHAALQGRPGEIRMYINGELAHTESSNIENNIGYVNTIGFREHNTDRYFEGAIDSFKLYNKSLSQTEIWGLYTAGRDHDRSLPGPAASWRMDNPPVRTGDGSDGSLTVTADNQTVNDYTFLTGDEARYSRSITVNDSTGFSRGDEILVHQVQEGTDHSATAGTYDFREITSVYGDTLNLKQGLQSPYYSGRFADNSEEVGKDTQVIRVPHYTDVVVDGGSITAKQWDGRTGGVVVFRANSTVETTNGGVINATGDGFRGGLCGDCGSETNAIDGGRGEGTKGWQLGGGKADYSPAVEDPNVIGGGGDHTTGNNGGDPGAGGGHATQGEDSVGDGGDSQGGNTIGDEKLQRMFFGGGGGSGSDNDGYTPYPERSDGGGIIFITAQTMNQLNVRSDGDDGITGTQSSAYGANSGGGAGGSVYLRSYDMGLSTTTARGGNRSSDDGDGEQGGAGGDGRIRTDYATKTGTTTPSAYKESLTLPDHKGRYDATINGDLDISKSSERTALRLDGNDDKVTAKSKIASGKDQLTLTAWIRPHTTTASQQGILGEYGSGIIFSLVEDDLKFFDTDTNHYAENTISASRWQHVAVSYDGEDHVQLYVNGEQKYSSSNAPSTLATGNSLTDIGEIGDNRYYFDGDIDDLQVYPVSLNQSHIQTVMNTGSVAT